MLLSRSPIKKNGHNQRNTLWERKVNATHPWRGIEQSPEHADALKSAGPDPGSAVEFRNTSGGVSSLATASQS